MNQQAFRLGRAAGQFFRTLAAEGVARRDALRLVGKLVPESIDAALAPDWAAAMNRDASLLQDVLAEKEAVACNRVPAPA